MKLKSLMLAAVAAGSVASAASAADFVDGNFELNTNENPSPWATGSLWTDYYTGGFPSEGVAYAANASGDAIDTGDYGQALAQTISGFNVGDIVTLSGLRAAIAGGPGALGANNFIITANDTIIFQKLNDTVRGWQSFTADSYTATGSSITFRFFSQNEFSTSYGVDAVGLSVTPGGAGPVPEPASWALMIAGFGLAGAAVRRRRALTA